MTIRLPAAFAYVFAALMLSACDQPPEQEGDAGAVVAKVGGKPITHGDVERAYESQTSERAKLPLEFVYDELLGRLIDRKLLANEARRQGADKDPEFRARMADAEENLLLDAWLFKKIDSELDEERLRAAYQDLIADFVVEPEIQARHILLASEKEANKVIARLDKGEPFNDLARELSVGPSASRGGDLGYFTKGRMIPVFSEAAFALAVGQYSQQPVKSEFGWHVILVEDSRDTGPESFDDARPQVRQTEAIKIYQETLDGLKAKAAVERFDPPGAQVSDEETAAPAEDATSADGPADSPADSDDGAAIIPAELEPTDLVPDETPDMADEEAETP